MMKRYITSLRHLTIGILVLGGMTGIALAGGGGYSSPPSGQLYSEYKEELSIGQEGAEGSVLYTDQLIDTALGYAWNRWTLRGSNSECFDSSNNNFSSDECWSGWAAAAADMTITVGYDARIYDVNTNALIPSGSKVQPGQRIRLEFTPLESDNIYWFATGYSLDSPYGEWREDAAAPPREYYENGGILADHVVCEAKDYTSTSHYEYGTNMFIVASTSEPYDISNATAFPYAESVLGATTDITLSSNGATLYEVSTSTVYQFSTASYGASYPEATLTTSDSNITGIDWSSDGSTFYATGATGDNIYQYSAVFPFSLSGASLEGQLSTQDAAPQDIEWASDGSRFYVVGGGDDVIRQYDVSVPWDISSASVSSSFDTPGENPTGIVWNEDGTKFQLSDLREEIVYEFVLSTAWDISTASESDALYIGANIQGLVWYPGGGNLYMAGFVPNGGSYTFDVYNVLVMDPPERMINTTGLSGCAYAPDGLSAECTVSGTATITPAFTFEPTYGHFYHRYYDSRDMGEYGGPGCYGNNVPVREIIGGEDNPDFTNPYGIPDSGVEPEPYRFEVPQQEIEYPLAVEGTFNEAPTTPSVDGPTSGYAEESQEFSFVATDPDNHSLRYGVDWNNDQAVDEWVPAGGYVNSGTQQTGTHTWFSEGEKTFNVLAQDAEGATSDWQPYTIEVIVLPDLFAGEPSASPSSPDEGETVQFSVTIFNSGSGEALGPFDNRFQIDEGNNGSWDTNLDAGDSVGNLDTGEEIEITSPTWTAPPGTHRARACADTPGSITELDEDNNCSSIILTFTVTPTPECSDGTDNDGDGLTDYPNDPQCVDADDTDERPRASQCADGLDNDGDGFENEGDSGCYTDCDPNNSETFDSSRNEDATCGTPEGFSGDVDIKGRSGEVSFADGPVVVQDGEVDIQWAATEGPCTLDGESVGPTGSMDDLSLTESHTYVLSCTIGGDVVEDTLRALVFDAEEF